MRSVTSTTSLLLRVIPKTFYDFFKLQASQSFTLRLASKIDVSVFTEAEWIIRLHGGTIPVAPAMVTFTSLFDGYDFGDPGVAFTSNGNTFSIASTNTPPYFGTLNAGANFGRLLGLDMTATNNGVGSAFNIQISVDLALKGGDPRDMASVANLYRGYGVQ